MYICNIINYYGVREFLHLAICCCESTVTSIHYNSFLIVEIVSMWKKMLVTELAPGPQMRPISAIVQDEHWFEWYLKCEKQHADWMNRCGLQLPPKNNRLNWCFMFLNVINRLCNNFVLLLIAQKKDNNSHCSRKWWPWPWEISPMRAEWQASRQAAALFTLELWPWTTSRFVRRTFRI